MLALDYNLLSNNLRLKENINEKCRASSIQAERTANTAYSPDIRNVKRLQSLLTSFSALWEAVKFKIFQKNT